MGLAPEMRILHHFLHARTRAISAGRADLARQWDLAYWTRLRHA